MDFYSIADAATRGVILVLFFFALVITFRVLRWVWRGIRRINITNVAETTGVVAGKADGAARQFARGFAAGVKKAKD